MLHHQPYTQQRRTQQVSEVACTHTRHAFKSQMLQSSGTSGSVVNFRASKTAILTSHAHRAKRPQSRLFCHGSQALWRRPEPVSSEGKRAQAELLEDLKKAMSWEKFCQEEVTVWGSGRHLGMTVGWKLQWRPDGAFREEVVGQSLRYAWGYPGSFPGKAGFMDSPVWQVDQSGYPQMLELDDWEEALLCAWARSSMWLHDSARDMLDITVRQVADLNHVYMEEGGSGLEVDEAGLGAEQEPSTVVTLKVRGGKVQGHLALDPETGLPEQMILSAYGSQEQWLFLNWEDLDDGVMFPLDTVNVPAIGGENTFVAAGLERGPLCNAIFTTPQLPPAAGFVPHWEEGARVARPQAHLSGTEGAAEASEWWALGRAPAMYDCSSVHFDHAAPPAVEMCRTRSGHILVWPLVDGAEVGPFILDTGASGLVLTPAAAATLELDSFGELWVAGMAGSIRSQYRRAHSFQIGPVTIREPLFMEMRLDSIVSGSPTPVAGIVGYDVLRHIVLEVPASASIHPPTHLHMYCPSTYELPGSPAAPDGGEGRPAEDLGGREAAGGEAGPAGEEPPSEWVPIQFVANVPHVAVEFSTGAGTQPAQEHLFMLDSGAGGVDCIFHARAAKRLNLLEGVDKSRGFSKMRGVTDFAAEGEGDRAGDHQGWGGGDQTKPSTAGQGVRTHTTTLDWVAVGDREFERVRAMVPVGSDQAFSLSEHTAGLVCGDLLANCNVVYDYCNRRIALLDPHHDQDETLEEAQSTK